VKAINAAAPETLLFDGGATFKTLHAWSRDGKSIVFSQLDPATGLDLWILPIDGNSAGIPVPYLRTPFAETGATLSPDGRWAAYLSTEGGRQELWVNSFPQPGETFRVTTGGALGGGFIRDGRLAYVPSSDRRIYVAAPVPGKPFRLGPARQLLTTPSDMLAIDAMPDASKLLMSVPVDRNPITALTVVSNWTAALKTPTPR
jgi:serine/threonine-protein kinase